jgi:hypothetical protein
VTASHGMYYYSLPFDAPTVMYGCQGTVASISTISGAPSAITGLVSANDYIFILTNGYLYYYTPQAGVQTVSAFCTLGTCHPPSIVLYTANDQIDTSLWISTSLTTATSHKFCNTTVCVSAVNHILLPELVRRPRPTPFCGTGLTLFLIRSCSSSTRARHPPCTRWASRRGPRRS